MRVFGYVIGALLLVSCNFRRVTPIRHLADQARAEASRWHRDAQLVQIEITDFSFAMGADGIPDVTRGGPPRTIFFSFISRSASGALRVIAQPGVTNYQSRQLQLQQLPSGYIPYSQPIPDSYIDFESAIAEARRDAATECGGAGIATRLCLTVQSAELHMSSQAKPLWKISLGQNPKTFERVSREVDATSGELVAAADTRPALNDRKGQSAGSSLYAYAAVPALDRNGRAVTDPSTGRQIADGFCIMWQPDWSRKNDHVPVTSSKVWWDGVSYQVSPETHAVTVYRVWGPNVIETPQGPRSAVPNVRGAPSELSLDESVTVKMYDSPQPGWPCTQETWTSIAAHYADWTRMVSQGGSSQAGRALPPWERIEGDPCAHSATVRKIMGCTW